MTMHCAHLGPWQHLLTLKQGSFSLLRLKLVLKMNKGCGKGFSHHFTNIFRLGVRSWDKPTVTNQNVPEKRLGKSSFCCVGNERILNNTLHPRLAHLRVHSVIYDGIGLRVWCPVLVLFERSHHTALHVCTGYVWGHSPNSHMPNCGMGSATTCQTDGLATNPVTMPIKETPSNKLVELSSFLECRESEMKNLLEEHNFLHHLNMELIQNKTYIMLYYNLPLAFVRDNPRILFQTSTSELNRRLKLLKESNLLDDNSVVTHENLGYYLECNNAKFAQGLKYLCDKRDSLEGCRNQTEYLIFRLHCSNDEAQGMMSTFPLKKGFSEIRLKRLLDFFLEEAKVSSDFVLRNRKILAFSVKRSRIRWKVMQAADINTENEMLSVWLMSQKKFEREVAVSHLA